MLKITSYEQVIQVQQVPKGHWKSVDCSLWLGDELLPQVDEITYLRVLFITERTMEQEIDRWIGAATPVFRGK